MKIGYDQWLDQRVDAVKHYLEVYDRIPAIDKIPPIMSPEIENVRWGLEAIVGVLADDDTRQQLGEEKWAIVEKGINLVEELKGNIKRTWDASDRG